MSKFKTRMLQIICFVVGLSLFSCEEDKRETLSAVSVYRIVKEDTGNYSYLAAAIDRAGLQSVLDNSASNITLLAPVNQAFIDAGYANVNAVKIADPAVLAKMLRYHIIENKIETKTIATVQTIKSIDGNELTFDVKTLVYKVSNTLVTSINYYINGADILAKDVNATNGNVQLINKVLVPKTTNSIMQAMTARADYSLFVAAINRASTGSRNYAAELSSTAKFTVFAPTNAAITDFLAGKYSTVAKIDAIDANVVASELVGNHIISNAYYAYNLPYGPLSLNLGRISVSSVKYFNASNAIAGTNTVLNGSLLLRNNANEIVSNGFVNGVSSVFSVPTSLTLLETIQMNTNLTYLNAAIERASTSGVDIKGMLSSAGNQTIFAPTNEAFKNEGYESIDIINVTNVDILVQLLTKHIFEGSIFSNSYPSGTYKVDSISGVSVEFDNSTVATNTYAAKGPLNTTFGVISTRNEIRTNGVFNIINQVIK